MFYDALNRYDPEVFAPCERELRRRLGETKTVGRTLHCFESVDSTNSYLKRIAAEGAPDGTVAVVMQVVQDIGQKVELENMAEQR